MKIQCKRGKGNIYGDAHQHPLLTTVQLAAIAGKNLINWAELQQPLSINAIYQPTTLPAQHVRVLDGFSAQAYDGVTTSVHHKLVAGKLETTIGVQK